MRIEFSSVILHNFLSYGHAEINLKDKGYCLVKGINNFPKDNAKSNGGGKSAWGSAICWALTGETINGLTQGLKNIYIEEDLCYVTLKFKVDKNDYEITRYKEPKSDLKIFVNGENKSGKGVRESEAILNSYLPDLSLNLLASIIILGQGLPCKFTDNTPSGRKEVLEKLSKSDFMINDLKERITSRTNSLQTKKRSFEDAILSSTSRKELLTKQLNEEENKLEELNKPKNFDLEIQKTNEGIQKQESVVNSIITELESCTKQGIMLNESLTPILEEKSKEIKEENDDFDVAQKTYFEKKLALQKEINALEKEISRLKSIKDVCPTCGQKIHGVVKPDTSKQENELSEYRKSLDELEDKFRFFQKQHNEEINRIEDSYSGRLSKIKTSISDNLSLTQSKRDRKNQEESLLNSLKLNLNQLQIQKASFLEKIEETQTSIKSYKSQIKKLEDEFLYNKNEKDTLDNHLSVLTQMMTLIKRDFRGFLLSNVIAFIDKKAKEYSKDIFNNDELDFALDGNNINITYAKKPFEALSGGEKQKVDLIIQFALRSMMSQYMNFSSNILLLDEITDNLDAVGCSNVLNLISNKINDVESIFIISHHAEDLLIPADTEMLIIKDKNGISHIGR